jgi:uncharacterized short protein YbdD (DUF466 family)
MSLEKILDKFAATFKEDLQAELLKKKVETNAGQDSRLGASIRYFYKTKAGSISLLVAMNDYWEYVDKGRGTGKMPPIAPIEAYLKKKGIRLIKKEGVKKPLSREKQIKQVAFAIAKTISKKGTIKRFGHKGANFYHPVLNDGRLIKLKQDILKETKKDLEIIIRDVNNNS